MTEVARGINASGSGHFLNELQAVFAARASQTAITYENGSITYAELNRVARCWAWSLQGAGVGPGDRVAITTPKKLPFLGAHLGALYAAAISLPINPRFTKEEVCYFLEDSTATAVVAGRDQRPVIEALRSKLPELRTVLPDDQPLDAPERAFSRQAIARDAPCLMLYSSGTTGWPKGVVHTHASLASALRALEECWRFTPDDVLVNVLPLFHIHGLSFAAHLSLLYVGHMLVEQSFHPRRALELMRCGTVFMAVPTFYYSLLERAKFKATVRTCRGLRLCTCGSAPIRAEVLPELEDALGHAVINRAYRDAAGFLTLVGRKHDLIITNGLNVYPQVVERVINECPGVRESAVVGVPDRKRGERVTAVVIRSDETLSLQVLRSYLSERLVDYQRPTEVVFVTSFPRNAPGKILRRELREQLTDH
jgi:malonyl-CoA/methylmalonyl-CoA synthetase